MTIVASRWKGVPVRRTYRNLSAVFATIGILAAANAAEAGVLMQGFYWDVPSPAAGNSAAPWWWDSLASKANEIKKAGFTAVWIPPVI